MMKKTLVLATAIQVAVFEQVLLKEIATGFWKNARPADHAEQWEGVELTVGTELGASGFEVPRNYNFVNPEFFSKAEPRLLAAAQTVNPEITVKQLKKQLIAMNQILGSRLKEVGGQVTKLTRGRKHSGDGTPSVKKTSKSNVRRQAANFVESTAETTETA